MNLELLTMLIFFAIVGILLLKDRKKVEFHGGLVIRRWKRGLELIDILIKKHTKAIKICGYVAVGVGFLACLCGFVLLIFSTVKMQQAFGLLLPTAAGYQYPKPVIGVPFWYWLIAIFVILFAHETMHGIFARAARVPLKNYGILLFFVLPIGAFVEPNMKRVKKLRTNKKLPFFAAGSFANFLVALLFLILVLILYGLLFTPVSGLLTEPKGVAFNKTIEGYPAYDANLTGMIKTINGIEIKTTENLLKVLNDTEVGKETEIVTNVSTYKIKTVARPDNQTGSFIGISSPTTIVGLKDWLIIIYNLFGWLVILNAGIGVANLLPWRPFDGGLMTQEILTKAFKKRGKIAADALMIITYFLVLFNLFGIKIIKAII